MTTSSVFASGETAHADAARPPWLEWALAGRPVPGEAVSGDAALVEGSEGRAVAVVADGLGHGPAAAEAAEHAVAAVRGWAGTDVIDVLRRCHDAASGTRGAALALALLDRNVGTLSWIGVGDIHGLLVRGAARGVSDALLPWPGVVGDALPFAPAVQLQLCRGDVLVLASDGIDLHAAGEIKPTGRPQQLAETLVRDHARAGDDALVLVARFLGEVS